MKKGIGVGGAIIAMAIIMSAVVGGAIYYTNQEGETDTEAEMANVNEWGIDAKLRFGSEISGDAYLITGEEPEDWGDYEDFAVSDATEDLKQGSDYYTVSFSDEKEAVFEELPSGDYWVYVDVADEDDIHQVFEKVEMPAEVKEAKAEDSDFKYTLAGPEMFTYDGEFDGADPVIYQDGTLDMGVVSSGDYAPTDEDTYDVEYVLTEEITDSVLLGDATVDFESGASSITFDEVTVEVSGDAEWSETYDADSDEVEDAESNDHELGVSDSPVVASDEVEVTVTFDEVDTSTLSSSDDLVTVTVEDIFGTDSMSLDADATNSSISA